MEFKIVQKAEKKHRICILEKADDLNQVSALTQAEQGFAKDAFNKKEQQHVIINQYTHYLILFIPKNKKTPALTSEGIRKTGAELSLFLNKQKVTEVVMENFSQNEQAGYELAEGMALASYQFLKYRKEATKITHALSQISFLKNSISNQQLERLKAITTAIYKVRTLVNEPLNFLSATQLSEEITAMGKEAGFKTRILNKQQIEKEKMGGILSVNRGSIDPPTFTIMEYKPAGAVNKNPVVLVGKGIVYDTGGLSLKPTPASMDRMKSDMSGAALVSGAMYAIAKMKLPLHVIALVPATDNRPGEDAYVPGDIITMYDGTTVEVLNTDAEGRLVLADALHWAKRYKPELVFDFATLTGAASSAIGEHGIVCMGNAENDTKEALKKSGDNQHERLAEFPMWDEYGEQIKSEIADLKNVGGATGGAITAGKFLEHFTAYPWMHFDIAGVSFSMTKKGYIPAGGTAFGLRMLLDFLIHYKQ